MMHLAPRYGAASSAAARAFVGRRPPLTYRAFCAGSAAVQLKPIEASPAAKRTFNPIRKVVDQMQVPPNPDLDLIPLSIGDPTVFGNFTLPEHAARILGEEAMKFSSNGYPNSIGYQDARAAISEYFSSKEFPVTPDDVVLTCGCSQALDLAISVLATPGQHNILLPRPGFSLYETLCGSKGIAIKYYGLVPERGWEADLRDMESKIDSQTSAILVNNPSNPCGSVFRTEHMLDILALAEKYNLPLIADEIYADMAFPKSTPYQSFDSLSKNVPILSVGGLAKQYMIPGWRVGWVISQCRNGRLKEVRQGLVELSTLTLGPSSILQTLVRPLLFDTPKEYYIDTLARLEHAKDVIVESLAGVPEMNVIEPQGAMYVMIGVDAKAIGFKSDVDFSKVLLQEESVFVLPGECFGANNFFRVVITPPIEKLKEACQRIERFCSRHRLKK